MELPDSYEGHNTFSLCRNWQIDSQLPIHIDPDGGGNRSELLGMLAREPVFGVLSLSVQSNLKVNARSVFRAHT